MAQWTDFKEAWNHSTRYSYPFAKNEVKGQHRWTSDIGRATLPEEVREAHEGTPEALFLIDIDTPRRSAANKSGAMTLKMAEGYTARFFIYTQNDEYFTENLKTDSGIREYDTGIFGGDSGIFFTLSGGDYISIDIDEVQTGIGNFRLRLDGEFQNKSNPKDMNNEACVVMLWCVSDDELFIPEPDPTDPRPDPPQPMPDPNPDPSPPPAPGPIEPEPEPEVDEEDDSSQNRFWGILALGIVAVVVVLIFTKSDGGGGEGGGPVAE